MNKRWILRSDNIRNLCVGWLQAIVLQDEHLIEVTVKPYKKNRSLEQNDMFHAWCGSIADKTGHSKEEIKNILIESVFGTEEYINLQGDQRTRIRQTSSMTTWRNERVNRKVNSNWNRTWGRRPRGDTWLI